MVQPVGRRSPPGPIARRRPLSQALCACRQPIRDNARQAANRKRVSPHSLPAQQLFRIRRRSQIAPIWVEGRSWQRLPLTSRGKGQTRLGPCLRHSENHYTVELILFTLPVVTLFHWATLAALARWPGTAPASPCP